MFRTLMDKTLNFSKSELDSSDEEAISKEIKNLRVKYKFKRKNRGTNSLIDSRPQTHSNVLKDIGNKTDIKQTFSSQLGTITKGKTQKEKTEGIPNLRVRILFYL